MKGNCTEGEKFFRFMKSEKSPEMAVHHGRSYQNKAVHILEAKKQRKKQNVVKGKMFFPKVMNIQVVNIIAFGINRNTNHALH